MLEPDNLFEPALYTEQRRPYLEALSLPAWCYTSQRFYRREVEQVFLKTWLFVGRCEEIAEAGDYRCVDTPGGPVILLRGRAGAVTAFANTCRHRGSRLLDGAGRCERAIICPYHGWSYDLDGSLMGAAAMENSVGFDRTRHGLTPIRSALWQGFIWINFDADAPSLESELGDMFAQYDAYNFSDMMVTRRSEYEVACNWKLVMEVASEDYHTGTVHRTSVGTQLAYALDDTGGNWQCLRLPRETSIGVLPGESTVFPHVPNLPPPLAEGTNFLLVYPNACFGCVQDCMWWVSFMPLGPDRCVNRVGFLFPRSTVERADFESIAAKYYHRWDLSIDEDNAAGEIAHQGMRSVMHRSGPYSDREPLVYRFANWLLDRVAVIS